MNEISQLPDFVKRRALLKTLSRVAMFGVIAVVFCGGVFLVMNGLPADVATVKADIAAGHITMFDVTISLTSFLMNILLSVLALSLVPFGLYAYLRIRVFYRQTLANCAEEAGITPSWRLRRN